MNEDENPRRPPILGPGPLTAEMVEKWMGWMEDVATLERDMGAATRFVLGDLIVALSESGGLDGQRFLLRLRERIQQLPHPGERLAGEVLVDELLLQGRATTRGAPGESRRGATGESRH